MFQSILDSRRFAARLLFSAALGLVASSSARADILAYDSFSGTPGVPVTATSGGTGFSGSWKAGTLGPDNSAGYVQQGSSLEGGSTTSLGGRVASLASYALSGGITRTLSSAIGTPGSTVYISLLVRADGTLNEGAAGGFFGLLLNSSKTTPTLSQDLFIGKGSGSNYLLEDRGGNNSHVSGTSAAIGVTNLLVVRADFAANGGPDKFTLYVDPKSATNMGPAVVKNDSSVGSISNISIYSTGAFSLDELRISTSLTDAIPAGDITSVPEPASVIMVAMGGLGVFAARRRSARKA